MESFETTNSIFANKIEQNVKYTCSQLNSSIPTHYSQKMNTFRNNQYTITTSLNERSAIYIKIANNISYMCYEGNFDSAAFKLPFELSNIYELVNKCFAGMDGKTTESSDGEGEGEDDDESDREEEDAKYSGLEEGGIQVFSREDPSGLRRENAPVYRSTRRGESYRVTTKLDNGILQLLFHCVVGGFLTVKFDLRLREKLMSNDTQLSINFQRVEQNQTKALERIDTVASQMTEFAKRMKEMERRLEALGHADICFTQPPSGQPTYILSYPIDSKVISINDGGNHINQSSFEKIKYFYQLTELTLNNCQWQNANSSVSSTTVCKLLVNNSPTFSDISFIKNFPELEDLEMRGVTVGTSIVTTLRSIKHKIKKLTFSQCGGINQTEMQTYCTQKGITLNLS